MPFDIALLSSSSEDDDSLSVPTLGEPGFTSALKSSAYAVEIKLNVYVLSTLYSLLILLSLPNTYVNFKYSGKAVNVVISIPEYFKALNVTALGEITFVVFLVAEFALDNIS